MRQLSARIELGLAQRDDRHDVGGANPWMQAVVLAQVDVLDRSPDRVHQPVHQPRPEAGHRDHDAVVVRVGVRVEHEGVAGGRSNGIDHVAPPSFGEVGHRLAEVLFRHSNR